MRALVRRSSWLAALGALLVAVQAEAGVLRVELVTKVRVGTTPSVKVIADQAMTDVAIELKRDDGQEISQRIGSMGDGESKEIQLDGAPGKHQYQGKLRGKVDGKPEITTLSFKTVVAPPLEITVDRSKVDMDERRFEITLSRPATTLHLKLLGVEGNVLGESTQDISGKAAKEAIVVSWKKVPKEELARMELRVTDEDGFFNGIALLPWSVQIPHQQVNFDNDSDRIKPSEEPKLKESAERIRAAVQRYRELGNVKLFIAGHTDTKGSTKHNIELSRRRARSIANWFGQHGLALPIFHEGFGESALLVKTADETDEPRNRRVDYILALEEPNVKSKGHSAVWKRASN